MNDNISVDVSNTKTSQKSAEEGKLKTPLAGKL